MDRNNIMECGGFYFIHNFDSGNLGHVERVPTELIAPSLNHRTNAAETPDYEFNLWTRPDCAGTEFENGNRTWFYFGIQSSEPNILVRLNLINLNKQGKMYNQGMAPVTRTLPGKPQWERIRDRPIHSMDDNTFTLTFKYRSPENLKATTFFAFTYPFSFAELQIALNSIDLKMLPIPPPQSVDDIYYHRECLIYSLEGRRVDLLTISSHHGITGDREDRLKNLFPDNQDRPYKFDNKKVIFISARVHPGETPSSFVFNGFLNLLLTRNDPIAVQLRKLYVFKLIPFLNPDGVARGHYRTDTRGVNLNRVYLNPSLAHHPTVYASRALIRYYHFGCEKEDSFEDLKSVTSRSIGNICESSEQIDTSKKKKPPAINSSGTATKANDRQDRSKSANKSSVTIKQPSQGAQSARSSRRDSRALSGDAANLAEQVFDMKLQEKSPLPPSSEPSLTRPPPSAATAAAANSPPDSLLERDVLRSCLGSDALLSTSEQLNLPGNNPLRPLRDTLKNSISLLMESTSSVVSDSTCPYSECRTSNVKMGWCSDCRQAVSRLEHTMPGITRLVPGYSAVLNDPDSMKFSEAGEMFFCTNCFKRYILNENDEEIKVGEPVSTATIPVSHGDSGEVRSSAESLADGTLSVATGGDAPVKPVGITINLQPSLPAQSEDKGKVVASRPGMLKKKPTPVAVVATKPKESTYKEPESGLYLYIDLHGHASKKGIFMYGNHFEDAESSIECMLLPRVMALNNLHFHFSSCNFTERNMYLKDRRDGMSREGSGRVAVLKATGLVRSYTLECNYNTGRLVNVLPPTAREGPAAPTSTGSAPPPPKYTPHIFEEVGRSLGASILDLTSHHPNSRIPCSEHRNLSAVREWLRAHTRTMRPQLTSSRLRPKVLSSSPSRVPLYARSKGKMIDERKENTYAGAKSDSERRRSPPVLAPRSAHDLANLNTKLARKQEPAKSTSRTRYLADNEPKPKTLTSKRRNILAIRKPNAGKTPTGGIVKAKVSRRSVDDSEPRGSLVSAKLSKRSFARSVRAAACRVESSRCRAVPSSSSDDFGGSWEEVAGGTAVDAGAALAGKRRPFPAPAPARLKKIRLKTAL